MNLKRKIATAIATGGLLLNLLSPAAFAATTIEISGNGSSSDNTTTVNQTQSNTVVQNNNATINNNVDATSNTGGNSANDNTGGSVTVDTGNARTTVDVTNRANSNTADVNNCNCSGDTTVKISGNGTSSDNNVNLDTTHTNSVFQTNTANFNNRIDANARTGDNRANDNTGGDVMVRTGSATSDVTVNNAANANTAMIGNGSGTHRGGTLSATISGNGSRSDNTIDLDISNDSTIVQDNNANFRNRIDANSRTGDNRADDNTGGDVTIDTGNARSMVDIDNMANFNSASSDCGCLLDLTAKISGNGTESDNRLTADLTNDLSVFQGEERSGNRARFDNLVDANSRTGDNRSDDNTGVPHDGILVFTGNSTSDHTISNEANRNIFGPSTGADFSLGGTSLDFSFNLNDLLGFLMLHR